MIEEWKQIKGYENLYEISNLGRIKSLPRKGSGGHSTSIIMKPNIDKNGYLLISLNKNKIRRIYKIHRLVAQHFIANPNNYPYINHKDEDKQNNCVDNLEWCTASYNNSYGKAHQARVDKKKKKVLQFSLEGKFIKEWESIISIQKELGYNDSNIGNACKGKYKQSYGFIWKYKG